MRIQFFGGKGGVGDLPPHRDQRTVWLMLYVCSDTFCMSSYYIPVTLLRGDVQ